MSAIVPIVEGHAEVESIPVLLRRLLVHMDVHHIQVTRPFRVKRNRIVRQGEIERAVKQAVRDRQSVKCILVLLDADDDCPAKLAVSLLKRAKAATHLPIAVVG